MKYIIMADGKGKRWNCYNQTPKHLVELNGETIIERAVRLLKNVDEYGEIIVTSHCAKYEFEGTVRYEPQRNFLEIDRFTEELIEDNICFIYGDTYYTRECIESIIRNTLGEITFFGNSKSIVGIKVMNGDVFRKHVRKIRDLYLEGKIDSCIGWQVYQSYTGLEIGNDKVITDNFIRVSEDTFDLNCPEDFIRIKKRDLA